MPVELSQALSALNLLVLGLAVWILRANHSATQRELKSNREEFKKVVESIHSLELRLASCVTWEELGRELSPLRHKEENHEARIKEIEVTCKNNHRKQLFGE